MLDLIVVIFNPKTGKYEILEGKNRAKICIELGIPIKVIKFRDLNLDMSPLEYVISKNIKRRHLTPAEIAEIVIKAMQKSKAIDLDMERKLINKLKSNLETSSNVDMTIQKAIAVRENKN